MRPFDYDFPYRMGRRYAFRAARRRRPARRPPRVPRREADLTYGEDYGIRSRMGMHDFAEHYGRYSGGSPYDYAYSERTIAHLHPRPEHDIGFTRRLREEEARRFPLYGRGFERRRRR